MSGGTKSKDSKKDSQPEGPVTETEDQREVIESYNNHPVTEAEMKTTIYKILNAWWEEKAKLEFNRILGKIENLDRKREEEGERVIREEAASTALARAREREIAWLEEGAKLRTEIRDLGCKIDKLKIKYDRETKRRQRASTTIEDELQKSIEILQEEDSEKTLNHDSVPLVPEKMSEEEYKWEELERKLRKNNILVHGFRTVGPNIIDEVWNVIYELTGVDLNIRDWRAIRGGLLLTLNSLENKKWIMSRKSMLRGTKIMIQNDLTYREEEIQRWIEHLVRNARQERKQARAGYMKWMIEDQWLYWSEEEGRPTTKNFFRRGNI